MATLGGQLTRVRRAVDILAEHVWRDTGLRALAGRYPRLVAYAPLLLFWLALWGIIGPYLV